MIAALVMFLIGSDYEDGEFAPRERMEWTLPTAIVLLGGGLGWMIVIKQFFRMLFFVRGSKTKRYGNVFDEPTPPGQQKQRRKQRTQTVTLVVDDG